MNKFIKGVIYVAAIASAVAAFVNRRNQEREDEEEEMFIRHLECQLDL